MCNGFFEVLKNWQSLIGAFLGASAPFLLWWFSYKYQRHKLKEDHLYYLERLLVDQTNNIIEAKNTIKAFLDNKLQELMKHIQENPSEVYSLDLAFFPLFSIRYLDESVHSISTGSAYLDNKIGQSYKFSKDMPFIIDDMRRQFDYTMQINKELSFYKLNSPQSQKRLYLENIRNFYESVRNDMLCKNIPIYLKILTQTRVALNEFKKSRIRWRLRFDPRFRFFKNKAEYLKAREISYEVIEKFFADKVQKELQKIEETFT